MDTTFHLLIIEASANDAEEYISTLRNQGIIARGQHAEDDEDMENILNNQSIDVILCSIELDHFSLKQALDTRTRLEKSHIPLIAVADELDYNKTLEVMREGADDLASIDYPEHFKLVLMRAMTCVKSSRKLVQIEQSFNDTEKRCNQLMSSSRDAITYVHEGMHIHANEVYLEMFGYTNMDELEGLPIMDMVIPEEQAKLKKYFVDLNKKKKDLADKLEVKGLKADGSHFDASMEFSSASIDGEACTQIIIRDQSINEELVEKLQALSNQDLLTNTYNRQYFMNELANRIAEDKKLVGQKEDVILYLDIDNFRKIKDRVGLTQSDLILSDTANLLRSKIADNDMLSRFSDHTFAVLFRAQKLSDIMALAEEVRQTFEAHVFEVGEKSETTTCSIGITIMDPATKDPQQIMSRADIACEIVRKEGNAVHLHDPIADERAAKELERQQVEDIKNAIKNNRLRMAFQPIISLLGDEEENWEVLVRMLDEDDNILLPEQFLGVAEKYKLVMVIDRWMIKNALSALAKQRSIGKATNFYIKLAGASFADDSLLPWLSQQLNALRIPGDSIIFEVNESVALNHLKATKKFLDGLKTLHCRFALTHFGVGPTPMNALRHIQQVDIIKLDGSLIRSLGSSTENQTQVKSLNETLHEMSKQTIATQVEDANSLAILWQCGVDYIQGNFLQEPLETLAYDFSGESV